MAKEASLLHDPGPLKNQERCVGHRFTITMCFAVGGSFLRFAQVRGWTELIWGTGSVQGFKVELRQVEVLVELTGAWGLESKARARACQSETWGATSAGICKMSSKWNQLLYGFCRAKSPAAELGFRPAELFSGVSSWVLCCICANSWSRLLKSSVCWLSL